MTPSRYQSRDGHTMMVRPSRLPEGIKTFQFSWDRARKKAEVWTPFESVKLCDIPGKVGPRKKIGEARVLCVVVFFGGFFWGVWSDLAVCPLHGTKIRRPFERVLP